MNRPRGMDEMDRHGPGVVETAPLVPTDRLPTVYLAGPEVFLSDGREVIERKRAVLERYGFSPALPHGELDATALRRGPEAISARNEQLMGDADLCIANLTPFRAVSADPGTVFEAGYLIGLGKAVFGYSNDPRDYAERVATLPGGVARDARGVLTHRGEMVEDHGWADNLMIEGAIMRRGWAFLRATEESPDPMRDLAVFEACVRRAATVLGLG